MKRRHLTTLRQIFERPVRGTIRWSDIEALSSLSGQKSASGKDLVSVFFSLAKCGYFIGRIRPQIRTRVRLPAFENGWKATVSSMNNIMEIDGYKAVVSLDPDVGLLRGEFLGLNGGADFYAESIAELRKEGAISLKVFMDLCREKGVTPLRQFSGRFNVRLAPETHEAAVIAAKAAQKSLNEWISDVIEDAANVR